MTAGTPAGIPRPVSAAAVIFGGAGFIGRHLARALLERGIGPVLLGDVKAPEGELLDGEVFRWCDVRRPIELTEVAARPLVFNLAAVHRTPGHPDHEYHETNESGARHVVAFCERHGVDQLWFTSSIAVYGPSEEPRTEASPLAPTTAYGRSKVAAEAIHAGWAAGGEGRRLTVVRPGTVFGPGEQGNFTRLARALRRRRFLYPGRTDVRKSCGYVDDLVASMLFMAERADPVALYNFSYAPPPTIEQVCSAFATAGGLPRPVGVLPLNAILPVARGLTAAGLTTFHPDRVRKLVRSTNIVPAELTAARYPWQTGLESAIARWRAAEPAGQFV